MLPLDKMMNVQQIIKGRITYNAANVFGMIVYTEENPHIVKVLRDQDYWNSLNARTRNWILYAVKPDENYSHLLDNYIMPQLGLSVKSALPVLIVFAADSNNIIYQREYDIDDSSETIAYQSIEATVKTISDAVCAILPENLSGPNVIREVEKALDAELAKTQWKRVTSEMKKFVDVVIFAKTMIGYLIKTL